MSFSVPPKAKDSSNRTLWEREHQEQKKRFLLRKQETEDAEKLIKDAMNDIKRSKAEGWDNA